MFRKSCLLLMLFASTAVSAEDDQNTGMSTTKKVLLTTAVVGGAVVIVIVAAPAVLPAGTVVAIKGAASAAGAKATAVAVPLAKAGMAKFAAASLSVKGTIGGIFGGIGGTIWGGHKSGSTTDVDSDDRTTREQLVALGKATGDALVVAVPVLKGTELTMMGIDKAVNGFGGPSAEELELMQLGQEAAELLQRDEALGSLSDWMDRAEREMLMSSY